MLDGQAPKQQQASEQSSTFCQQPNERSVDSMLVSPLWRLIKCPLHCSSLYVGGRGAGSVCVCYAFVYLCILSSAVAFS